MRHSRVRQSLGVTFIVHITEIGRLSVHTSVRSDLPKLGEKNGELVFPAEIERALESLLVSEVAVSVDRLVGRPEFFFAVRGLVETDCRA